MQTDGAITQVEAAMAHQTALAAGDPALEAAAEAIVAALRPALQRLAYELAEQAAAEVAAQLPDHEVEVVLRESEPALRVRPRDLDEPHVTAQGEARVTLRLPDELKELLEEEAEGLGDSVNAWVVKALSSRLRASRPGHGRGTSSGEFVT